MGCADALATIRICGVFYAKEAHLGLASASTFTAAAAAAMIFRASASSRGGGEAEARRKKLLLTYRFRCKCTRCVEQIAGLRGGSGAEEGEGKDALDSHFPHGLGAEGIAAYYARGGRFPMEHPAEGAHPEE